MFSTRSGRSIHLNLLHTMNSAIGPQSAFGHYRSEKAKAGMTPVGRKIKGKYLELCNKKKNKKLKKAAVSLVKKSPGKVDGPTEDWAVRKAQFNQLTNGKGKSKKVSEFEEDSREAGKKMFQHLLSPTDVEKFMR